MGKGRNNKQQREYYKRNKETILMNIRRYRLKNYYDVTLEEYEKMFEEQGGKCAICKQEETYITYAAKKSGRNTPSNLCVDHDHKTGIIRGLLCRRCNHALGSFEDDIELFKNAIAYLRKIRGFR